MNRRKMKRGHQATAGNSSGSSSSSAAMAMPSGTSVKSEQQEVGIMDELLAIFGYKVQPSEMAQVVQRFEQLDMVFDPDHPHPTAVHYSPCDISAWSHSNDDLRAIPGPAAYAPPKRIKLDDPERGLVLVDAQEAGIRLVHTLMACAEAVHRGDLDLADALVKRVGDLAAVQPGAMRKVATCFAVALARRIYSMPPGGEETAPDLLQAHFYEAGPYLKFAHFTANQAILEAFEGWDRVHVVDLGLVQGHQWPALMQALALRPAGPPAFRLTGIAPDGSDQLRHVGARLARLAESVGVEFEFRGVAAASVADVDAAALRARPDEAVAVNAVFELHRHLAPGGAWGRVAEAVRSTRPRIVTVVEQEACHNGGAFLERFTEALHYYSTMFDSLEISPPSDDRAMAELYLGSQICDVVAREGPDRVERHEPLHRWRERLGSAGFEPVQLGSNAFKQASMLLELFAGGGGFGAEENDGCLMLCWHNRPLIATSAWRLTESTL